MSQVILAKGVNRDGAIEIGMEYGSNDNKRAN